MIFIFIFFQRFSVWIKSDNIFDYVQYKIEFSLKNSTKKFHDAIQQANEAVSKQNEQLVNSPMQSCSKNEAGAVASILSPSDVKKITLKTIAINDLLKTFDDTKPALRAIFDERRKILDRFNCGNGYDYLTVLYRIATPTQQQQMYWYICKFVLDDIVARMANRDLCKAIFTFKRTNNCAN